jgi:hypothetical protein
MSGATYYPMAGLCGDHDLALVNGSDGEEGWGATPETVCGNVEERCDPKSAKWALTPANIPTSIQQLPQKSTVNPKRTMTNIKMPNVLASLDSSMVKFTPGPLVG